MRRIVIVACGTSYHAGLVGRYAIEQWARVPVEMDIASEYRYRDPVVGADDLVIGITQSGETADTLAAMRLARERGREGAGGDQHHGQPGDPRRRHGALHPRRARDRRRRDQDLHRAGGGDVPAGAVARADAVDTLPAERIAELIAELKGIPSRIDRTIESVEDGVSEIAAAEHQGRFFLYLGRNIGLPVCLEGALKMKEISYIPTDAYAAGEMKHGPDRPARRVDPGGLRRHRQPDPGQGALQHGRGAALAAPT